MGTHPNLSPPATYHHNKTRTPIDTFFGSSTVEVNRAGYLPFDAESPTALSDGHWLGWIEVRNRSILGKEIPHSSSSIKSSGICAKDPRIRKKYNKRVRREYIWHSIYEIKRRMEKYILQFKEGRLKNSNDFKIQLKKIQWIAEKNKRNKIRGSN